jgi:ABC-type phosphate transport system substrate-binding protein
MATLEHLTKMTEAEVKALLASYKDSIRTVRSDAEVIDAVATTPGAIGFVEERSITDRVSVVKVDGKLPLESGYLPH